MTRVTLGFAEQSEELGLGQLGLPEHLVEERCRDVATLLMAQADLEDLAGRKSLLPGLMLLAPYEPKVRAPQDHPELAIGGRRHLGFEEAARSCWRGIEAESPDVAGMGRAVGTLAEPIEIGHVLLRVIEGHVDQPFERIFGSIGFGRKIELRTQRDEDLVAGLDDRRQAGGGRLQDNGHEDPPLKCLDPNMYDESAEGVSQMYLEGDSDGWSGAVMFCAPARLEGDTSHEARLAHFDHVPPRPLDHWWGVALAQELGPKWLAGTWKAVTPSPAGMGREDQWEIVVKEDGSFKGDVQSARGGLINLFGRWKIAGVSVMLDGMYQGGPSGEALEGTRYSAWNNSTIPISFKKAK